RESTPLVPPANQHSTPERAAADMEIAGSNASRRSARLHPIFASLQADGVRRRASPACRFV
ncbi:MAG: hypothetical protein WAJ85_11930, partial [Candidatus Baltobacteraceae bacterium]